MNNQISEQDLFKKVDKLPTEMTPERDLWLGIERAIQDKQQSSIVPNGAKKIISMAWAASVVAAVLVTWLSISPSPQNIKPPVNLVAEMQEQLAQLASARQSIEKAALTI